MSEAAPIASMKRIREQVEAYSGAVSDESWKKDHEEAMGCFHLEAYISQGIHIFEMILDMDTRWQNLVFFKKVQDSTEVADAIRTMFSAWTRPCPWVEQRTREFEALGYRVEGAEAFRKHRSHVNAILGGLPTTWRGHRIRTESELAQIDFPYPPSRRSPAVVRDRSIRRVRG